MRIVVQIPPGAGKRTRYQTIRRALQQAQDEMIREMLIKGEKNEYKEDRENAIHWKTETEARGREYPAEV